MVWKFADHLQGQAKSWPISLKAENLVPAWSEKFASAHPINHIAYIHA